MSDQKFAHMVFFTLKDKSESAQQRLVQACRQFLSDHPGTEYFATGTLASTTRDVNDRDFQVALHLVFQSKEAHDQYQAAPRHQEFIDQNKENWDNVRVFDSIV